MKTVIIGSNGQLGKQFIRDYGFPGFDLPEVDITRPETFRAIRDLKPTTIINCAAYTAVDKAEEDQSLAKAVNATGAGHLAQLAKELDAVLVQVSTDYVFKGDASVPYSEDISTDPLNFYGQTKLEGEQQVIESGAKYIIARTAWLYGTTGPNFVLTMQKLAKERPGLKVVTDQTGSPTWTKDLSAAIIALLSQKARGIFNVVDSGAATKYEFVSEICKILNLPTKLVPATTKDFPTPAKRPSYSVLSNNKLSKYYKMPNWQDSLASYLKELATHD